jgi:hypothetical protein
MHTAIYVGGSNVAAGEALYKKVLKTLFGPFSVSVMMDSNGSNTTAAATVLGALVTVGSSRLQQQGLAVSAGVTLYVAGSSLIPEFQSKRGWAPPLAFFGGVLAFLGSNWLLARYLGS